MAEKAVNTASSALTAEGLTPLSVAEKRHQSNCHGSPARVVPHPGSPAVKNHEVQSPALVTEKKPQLNGLPSPLRLPGNNTNNHAGKQYVEGYLRTDDRMRLAKERREERDKGLAVREQAIMEKERRAQLQYERTVEERWRKLEEQRQKEELRRAAVEEKRRQRLEEEKERLDALMKRSLERSLQLEQRPKRWTWGGVGGAQGDCENAPLPASTFPHELAAPFPAASESAPCSPHRSPYRGSPSRANRQRLQGSPEESAGGSISTPQTPKKERLRRERRTGSPATSSPVRRAESPAMFTGRSASPATPKLLPKNCTQSPCTLRQYHSSPIRHRPTTPVTDGNKKEDGQVEEAKGHNNISDRNVSKPETPVKKMSDIQSPEKSSQADTAEKKLSNTETPEKRFPKTETPSKNLKGEISEKKDNPDKKSPMTETADRKASKIDTPDRKMPKPACSDLNADKSTEPSSVTPTGKGIARTTSAEEASRLLAERRRLARVQKELEEKQRREQEEDERLKAEQLRRRQAEERARQEEEARRAEEERSRQEDLRRMREEEEKLQREGRDKELQVQMDREKEEAELQAQKDAERQHQEREILKLQQEEERHLRKKRIEEIMKRTRKSDENQAEMKNEEGQVDTLPQPVSPPGEMQINSKMKIETNAQVNVQENPKVESQVNGQVTVHVNKQDSALVKGQAIYQVTPLKNDLQKGQGAKQINKQQTAQVNGQGAAQVLKQESVFVKGRVASKVNQQESAQVNAKTIDQMNRLDNTKRPDAPQAGKQESVQVNVQVKKPEETQVSSQATAQLKIQESTQVNVKLTTQTIGQGVQPKKPSVASLPVGRPPPLINLEPLVVKSSGVYDEVQSMEVSPVSKEELVSIPEYSPVNEVQHNGMSNARALEDLLDLTGHVAYPKLSPMGSLGDCNKNLIEGLCSPGADSKLIQSHPPPSHKFNIQ
ncbi:MAP7 domain-containing protein 2 isoform X2 [Salmo salar]|uniref:MAP7 domain-containing protein 2 isoform X2 n=1 Tax=Salmo salar TaxID=8030 RepID=A0A1S3L1T7_SALSA|nr:MAP7 domain-containing protein 2-like isoform X2 [Salmo salar]|eukprot:XP_013984770.1 PREDICTED: MAP7 domain-containing protein 2-like isoform X2 [Salmo salar]